MAADGGGVLIRRLGVFALGVAIGLLLLGAVMFQRQQWRAEQARRDAAALQRARATPPAP